MENWVLVLIIVFRELLSWCFHILVYCIYSENVKSGAYINAMDM
jgi:hypothetical protein